MLNRITFLKWAVPVKCGAGHLQPAVSIVSRFVDECGAQSKWFISQYFIVILRRLRQAVCVRSCYSAANRRSSVTHRDNTTILIFFNFFIFSS